MSGDSFIQVPVDQGGKKVATQQIIRPDLNDVERQEWILASYQDQTLHTLVQELIKEVRDLKFALLDALH